MNVPSPPAITNARPIYRSSLLVTSVLLAWLLYEFGCDPLAAVAVPLVCLPLLWVSWNIFVISLVLTLYYAVFLGGIGSIGPTAAILLSFTCTCLLAVASRIPALLSHDPWAGTRVPQSGGPVRRQAILRSHFNLTHCFSVLWIGLALSFSTWLAQPLWTGLRMGPHIGLLPEPFFLVTTTLFLFVIATLARGVVHYVRLIGEQGDVADLELRQAIWNWQGGEARRVARAYRRQLRGAPAQQVPSSIKTTLPTGNRDG